ncbi:hypothetical protein MsAg5_16920 [Methanosarcinaceae archaeon Ag5]|uniref:Uncharacterized protein n=1 Tax=Methanolapillus africanus TaxID=3028297 RepID=A0AAE4MLC9_9EURY|nr:hypothetical protein [Methanosarcinaceae archaeon Ag5]
MTQNDDIYTLTIPNTPEPLDTPAFDMGGWIKTGWWILLGVLTSLVTVIGYLE